MADTQTKQTIVLDVMGADAGPEPIILGGLDAARHLGEALELVLVGQEDAIKPILTAIEDVPTNVRVQHAPTEVPMTMSPSESMRKQDSSIAVGLQMVKSNQAAAFLSPGNTGAVMASSLVNLGRIEGVVRPAISGRFPTSIGRPCVVLDVGANSDCKPQHLSQFAIMGAVYSEVMFGTEYPRVGLISIGEERSKGNELIFAARKLLNDSRINFVGNIEGRDILSGAVDVAVTDGFTGNIILKLAESIKPMLVKAFKRQVQTNILSRFGAMLLLPFLRRMRNTFDYQQVGGAPLLGVNGVVIICHGSSNEKAISSAVVGAHGMARGNINQRIQHELTTNHFGKHDESRPKSQNIGNGVVCTTGRED